MLTVSNSLSFVRAPLALVFLHESPTLRLIAVFLAMITDSVDGYLARRYRSTSRFGAILDPAMDKFFVYFVLSTFYMEGIITIWHVVAMLSRDFSLCAYGLYMWFTGHWKSIVFRAIRWGKITTALQFIVLIGWIFKLSFPWFTFAAFAIMGLLAFLELFQVSRQTSPA